MALILLSAKEGNARMARDYTVRLPGVSRERMNELRWVCRQYRAYRQRLAAMRRGEFDRPARGNGRWRGRPDPTAGQAVMLADSREAKRIAAIEAAARAADPELYRYILRSCCDGVPWQHLGAPCGVNQFYRARRRFFAELDERI